MIFKVEIMSTNNKKELLFVSAKDNLEAIDKVMKEYKNRKIVDIKVV